jgi:hypothetical protein
MCAHFSRSDSDDDEFWADMATIQDAMRVGDDIVHNSTPAKRKLGGSLPGKQPNIARDFREAEARLCRDYFDEGWFGYIMTNNFAAGLECPENCLTV